MYYAIKHNGRDIGLEINPQKTQLICISSNPCVNVECKVNIEGRFICSSDRIKVLGFVFGPRPNPGYPIDHLVTKFNKLLRCIYLLKGAKLSYNILLRVYMSMLRPWLEYASNAFHSMLTNEMSEKLERCHHRLQ